MVINKKEIKKYFSDRVNLAIFVILAAVCVYAILVRFINLGTLSYWGDDGQTFTGTLGVLEHGMPRLPSGNVMYHTFLHFYTRAIPAIIFGLNEFALRFPSAFFGVMVIPLVFLFVKEMSNRYVAAAAAIISSFSMWQIEYSREVRYYSEFQFLYLISVYFFYKGYFRDEKKFRVWALVFIFLTTISQQLGFTLIFLFVPLLLYKKFKNFFRRDIIIALIIVIVMIGGELLHRELFWKAGLSFADINATAGITNPLLRVLSKYFAPFVPFYHRIYGIMFPQMYRVFFWGILLIIPYTFIPWIRNADEDWISIYRRREKAGIAGTGKASIMESRSPAAYSIELPFNFIFLYFIFYSNTVFNGFGFMTTQQRYIYHVHPVFIALYCYIIFDIGRIAWVCVHSIYGQVKKRRSAKKGTIDNAAVPEYSKLQIFSKYFLYFAAAAVIFCLTVNWANPVVNFKITGRQNGDEVISEFAPSSTFSFHHDAKTPGEYIFEHKKEGDIVIATDLLNPYGYTRQIDYWLWTGGFSQWQPYVYRDGKIYDEFFGVPLIRDLYQFYKVLNTNADKNIWLITSNSMRVPTHISKDVAEFIYSCKDNLKITGKDGVCQAYLFEKTDKSTRGYFFIPEDNDIIKMQPVDFPTVIGFSNKDNAGYFRYGWSQVEPQGTWADRLYSVLFLQFKDRINYKMTLNVMSLYDPLQPQEMEVILNNKSIGNVQFRNSEPVEITMDIPADIITTEEGSYNILEFNYKYLLSPISLGVSQDARTLAVYFQRIVIEKSSS